MDYRRLVSRARVARSALVLIGLLASPVAHGAPAGEAPPASDSASRAELERFFENRVRPLLAARCESCHGAKRQRSALRVDSRAAFVAGGERGAALVPGDPRTSLFLRAVRHEVDDLQMPPKERLDATEIATLERWVEVGAPWPESTHRAANDGPPIERLDELRSTHWAFRPLADVAPPGQSDARWAANEIDRFVLARLESAGIAPSPRADPRALLRRAFIDLIGLPPSAAELDAFAADPSPERFAAVVDELLARPEHGERWGRHWLDVARYADTKGYVDGGERRYPFAWTYRDWVTRALHEDLPFDRFVLAQVAADRLGEGAGARDLAALGFLTVGSRFTFFPQEILDDRIDVVARGLMGLTVGCARCHDHKYDPISSADYYALQGVFASSHEPSPDALPVLGAAPGSGSEADLDGKAAAELREKAGAYRKRRDELHQTIAHEMRAWASDYLRYLVETTPRHRTLAQPPLRTERGVLREATAYGRGAVARWRSFIDACGADHRVFGPWNRLVANEPADVERLARELVAAESAGEPRRFNELVVAGLRDASVRSMVDVARVYGRLLEEIDALARAATASGGSSALTAAQTELAGVLGGETSPAVFTLDDSEDLYHLDEHVDVRAKFAEIERVFLRHRDSAAARAMALVDRAQPIEPRVLVRGDPARPAERVARRLPLLLAEIGAESFCDGSGRLELARGIVDPRNPLTARVIVNRVWAWHFGRGLVDTPSDFGTRAAPPTHTELLDWLARRFIADGWSLRALHRRIVLSATWQQSSVDRRAARSIDPENRLLWRRDRARLDLEAMRDSMLAVAGRLELGYRGPPVAPAIDDPTGTRRTLYCEVGRELLDGVYRVFDFPSPDLSSPERPRTTVPQQALFLLNSPFVLEQADALARAVVDAGLEGDVEAGVRFLHRRVLGRDPEPEELVLASGFVIAREPATHDEKPAGPSPWSYGHGELDAASGRITSFSALPWFDGEHWQGGESWPDAAFHFLRLSARGGHAGIDAAHAAVRRWTAPVDAEVEITGELAHVEEACGDGVRGRVVSSAAGVAGEWVAFRGRVVTTVARRAVRRGETIDFVVDPRENHFCDLFGWAPVVRVVEGEDAGREWRAREDFAGPLAGAANARPSPWAELAHALLMSNEFLFVD